MFQGKKELSQFTIVDTLNIMTNNENFLKLLIFKKETDEYLTAELKPTLNRPHGIKSYTIQLNIDTDPRQESYRINFNDGESSGLPHGQLKGHNEKQVHEQIIKFDTEGNVCKFVYPKVVKFGNLKENDFTMTVNLNIGKKVNEMIKGIVENYIKSNQISEKERRKKLRNWQSNQNQEALLNEDIMLKRADFDFLDLKAQMEINGMSKHVRYFVFRFKNEVVYQRFITDQEQYEDFKGLKIDKTVSETLKLDLKLRKAGIITQFLPLDNKHHIQFMFYDPTCKRFFLFTWDLQANREVKMLKLEKTSQEPYFQLTRGNSLSQNYIVMHGVDKIYDLHLEFSQNFISGKRVWGSRRDFEINNNESNLMDLSEDEFMTQLFKQAQSQMHEIKANYDGSLFLGLRKSTQTQLHRGFSLFDLQYIDYILITYGLESQSFNYQSGNLPQPLILDYLNVQLPYNTNIVHIYHRSSFFLSILLRELTEQMQEIQRDPQNYHAEEISSFLYYSLIPLTLTQGIKGKRGLSMALKGSYGECFELMIKMLMLDSCGINYMRHVKPYIIKLLSYDSDIIRNFLKFRCSNQLYSLMLTADQQEKYFENYMGTNSEYINLAEDKESQKTKGKACPYDIIQVNFSNRVAGDQFYKRESEDEHQEIEGQKRINNELMQQNKSQKKKIKLYSYDFEGYLFGERSKLFLSYIIQQDNNLKIFDLNYIKIYLDYQWRKLECRYFLLLSAYIINNILMVLYVVIQQYSLNCSKEDYKKNFCQKSLKIIESEMNEIEVTDSFFKTFRTFLIVLSSILIILEFIRQKNQKNIVNTIFLWINIAYVVKQLADIRLEYWFRDLMKEHEEYFLTKQISDIKANTIIDKEWAYRIVSIPIFIIKATNSFFMVTLPMQVLYKVRYIPSMSIYLPKFFIAIQQIKGLIYIFITFTFSFLFSYTIMTVLDFRMGELQILDPHNDISKIDSGIRQNIRNLSPLFGGFIQIMTQMIFCFGVMMIMYIGAAMIKADQKATEEFEQLKLINLARLIVENEILINRKKLYENVHYVIHSDVKKEKIRSAFTIMNSQDQEQRGKKLEGARRKKRKCCAAWMQGKPLELVYEAK